MRIGHQVVQPALAVADRLRVADRRGRGREGAAHRAVSATFHRAVSRHGRPVAPRSLIRFPGVAAHAALLQSVLPDLHRPCRRADPVRPSASVLDAPLDARQGLVSHPEPGACRSALDGQAGLDQPPGAGRPAGASPLDRPRALVAPRRRRALAAERRDLLRPALCNRPVAPPRPDQLGGVPERRVGADPVPLAELAARQRLGRLQRPAADRLLHHRLRRRPARPDHRPRHVTRAVDAVQADQQDVQHPDRALAALPRARLVPASSS